MGAVQATTIRGRAKSLLNSNGDATMSMKVWGAFVMENRLRGLSLASYYLGQQGSRPSRLELPECQKVLDNFFQDLVATGTIRLPADSQAEDFSLVLSPEVNDYFTVKNSRTSAELDTWFRSRVTMTLGYKYRIYHCGLVYIVQDILGAVNAAL